MARVWAPVGIVVRSYGVVPVGSGLSVEGGRRQSRPIGRLPAGSLADQVRVFAGRATVPSQVPDTVRL